MANKSGNSKRRRAHRVSSGSRKAARAARGAAQAAREAANREWLADMAPAGVMLQPGRPSKLVRKVRRAAARADGTAAA